MDSELSDFEQNMQREISAYLNPGKGKGRAADAVRIDRPATPVSRTAAPTRESVKGLKTGHIVKLAVRRRQLELDTVFEHHSTSISKLEAQLEAEKAAREAGYPIIGYLVDIQRL